jgi:hypothetical protein
MLRGIGFALALIALAWMGSALAADSSVTSILNGQAEIAIPVEFTLMSDELKRFKYPTGNPPQEVYTDEDGAVNIAATTRALGNTPKLAEMVTALSAAVGRARNIPQWHDKGTRTINGRDFGYLEFTVTTIDTEVYNYIYFTFEDGKLIMLTVNSTVGKLAAWKDRLKASVDSTRIVAK